MTPEAAKTLVSRFKGLKQFPRGEEGIEELVKAMQTAPDHRRAEYFTNDWIRNSKQAPYPADIYCAFASPGKLETSSNTSGVVDRMPNGEWPPPRYKCNQCEDTGFYLVPSGKTWEGAVTTAARKCPHPITARGLLA